MMYDNKCTIGTVTSTKNSLGMLEDVMTFGSSVPCYITESGSNRDVSGTEGVRMTYLLYVPYGSYRPSQVVKVDSDTYEVTEVATAPRRHHSELTLVRRVT